MTNSYPGIYQWHLPVFPGMENKTQVGNTGKYYVFAVKWQICFLAVKRSRYLQEVDLLFNKCGKHC